MPGELNHRGIPRRPEAVRLVQALRFGEIAVGLTELCFGPFAIVDVNQQNVPADDAPAP
jgi:hypothetical protein